jgi:hypothetical protein
MGHLKGSLAVVSNVYYIITSCLFLSVCSQGNTWAYDSPDTWNALCKVGVNQSPVHIDSAQAYYDPTLAMMVIFNLDSSINGTFVNMGKQGFKWAVDDWVDLKTVPKIVGRGGGFPTPLNQSVLNNNFNLHYILFHWGDTDCQGSEHIIDYHPSPLEMQAYFSNSRYTDGLASSYADGWVAISILFSIQPMDNLAFNPMLDAIGQATNPGTSGISNVTFLFLQLTSFICF